MSSSGTKCCWANESLTCCRTRRNTSSWWAETPNEWSTTRTTFCAILPKPWCALCWSVRGSCISDPKIEPKRCLLSKVRHSASAGWRSASRRKPSWLRIRTLLKITPKSRKYSYLRILSMSASKRLACTQRTRMRLGVTKLPWNLKTRQSMTSTHGRLMSGRTGSWCFAEFWTSRLAFHLRSRAWTLLCTRNSAPKRKISASHVSQ